MKSALWLAVAGLLANATVWGLSWIPFRSLSASGIHPLWATGIICAVAALALAAARPGALRECLQGPGLLWLALASGLTNALFNSAVAIGDVVRVVLLFYLMPIWAVLLARWLLGEPFTGRAFARIATGFVGAMLVLYDPGMGLPLPRSLADWMAIAGGAAFALNNVVLRKLSASGEAARTLSMLSGAVLLPVAAASLLSAGGAIGWPAFGASGALATLVLWSALFLVANLGLQYGAARLPANVTAVIMLTEVLVATGSSWLGGAAELRAPDLLGGMLILAAPWVFADRRPATPAAPAAAPDGRASRDA
ncbi:MAG: DMT family transporter [Betaproteobacteria bacterium]|jgi:drug/metabolite transporter (DMT)-like permease|nr:DMT family transporter [Betaproteobacteria bacterium]